MSELVSVQEFSNPSDAELAKEILESNGIKAMLVGEHSAFVNLDATEGIRLLVQEDDVPAALEILEGSDMEIDDEEPHP